MNAPPSKAWAYVQEQLAAGKTQTRIAEEIGYSRPAVTRYLDGDYGARVGRIEAAILTCYDRRICPEDGQEKPPEHCRRVAWRPRPTGFPDAESLWLTCQTCPHKPTQPSASPHSRQPTSKDRP